MKGVRTCVVAALIVVLTGVAGLAAELKIHREGRIRVVYQTEGLDAVRLDDRNKNGIPDQVEDVLTQTVAARLLFVELLGFPDPLKTERFGLDLKRNDFISEIQQKIHLNR